MTAVASGASVFDKPIDNVGDKTFGSPAAYETYANQHIYDIAIPGCDNGRVFVGQRKEPFYIAVGKIFDLFNMNPLGPEVNGNKNDLENKNVSSIALEVPIACLTRGHGNRDWCVHHRQPEAGPAAQRLPCKGNSVSGRVWRSLDPGLSRLGMPLVNEVVIGLNDKNKFNASKPKDDAQFADYVTNPTLPALVETLFPTAKAPTNFPRTDLVTVFLKGIKGLNQPASVVASEMLRLNTAIAPVGAGAQSAAGVAGGDNAGFPNGRRPGDDVVDLSVRVAMGALCVLTGATDTLQVGCKPTGCTSRRAAVYGWRAQDRGGFSRASSRISTRRCRAISITEVCHENYQHASCVPNSSCCWQGGRSGGAAAMTIPWHRWPTIHRRRPRQ